MTTNYYLFNIFIITLVLSIKLSTSRKTLIINSTLATSSNTFNVVNDFGAKGDGSTDETPAFLNAWKAACENTVSDYSEIYVPGGTYVLKSTIFQGPCKLNKIILTIDGQIVAHDEVSKGEKEYWIYFLGVDGLQIKGGTLDGKGETLWNCKASSSQNCPDGATGLGFGNSQNIIINGLTSKNSEQFHITFDTCQNVFMNSVTIIAPEDSPNTDGIHLHKTRDFTITHSTMQTGDDCISIGPGTQNLWIENINCGPGHGISIGSLGRDASEAPVVKNVTVKSVAFSGTQNGVRIKTFSTPYVGGVQDIHFIGATMNNVQNPIIIDQNYCPHNECPGGQGSNIQIKNVEYKSIHGTSSTEDILIFDCSPSKPCNGIKVEDIVLSPYQKSESPKCTINNANWDVVGSQVSDCLHK